jgi:hypothetical protein
MSAALLRRTLRRQLSAYFPADALGGPFVAEDARPLAELGFRVADVVVRQVAPIALEAQAMGAAAEGLRAIAPLADRAACFKAMTANERVARANEAPPNLVKAIGGVASTAIMLGDAVTGGNEDKIARAADQLASAVVRVVAMCVPLVPERAVLLAPIAAALA